MDNLIQPAFTSGEISPTLFGRIDLDQYAVGVAKAYNVYVDYRGGLSNRTGTKFVGQCKASDVVRFIKFQFGITQNYVLEFTDQAMRVIMNGAYVLEPAETLTGITQANPGVFTIVGHPFLDGDWVFLTGIGGMTQMNQRTGIVTGSTANTFQLFDPITGLGINTTSYGAYSGGGSVSRVYTLATPYTFADLYALKYTQSADVMTITHNNYAPRDLTRTGHAAWTLTVNPFGSSFGPPTGLSLVPSSAGTSMYAYQVTAVSPNGDESIASLPVQVLGLDISVAPGGNIRIVWNPVVGASYYNVYKANQVKIAGYTTGIFPISTLFGYMESTEGNQAIDTNIIPDFSLTPSILVTPFAPGQVTQGIVTAAGAGYTAEPTVNVTGGGGSGAILRAILNFAGGVNSIVVISPGTGYTSAPTLTLVGGGGAGATATATVGPSSGTYPGVVAYFAQRRVYASTINEPQSFWMSRPGVYHNFNKSNPLRASDSIVGTLASLQINAIKHLVPMPGGLIALTSYGTWLINGGTQNAAIDTTNANADAQAYLAAADVPPIVINYDILYIQGKGANIIRDLYYDIRTNIYSSDDITPFSSHLFVDYSVVAWDYAESPNKIVWIVRSDGRAVSLTFLKEQKVIGYGEHATNGLFKSVCTIQEGNEDVTYFAVQRYIQNNYVIYTERLASRRTENAEFSWFLDSALQTQLTFPAATLTVAAASGVNVLFTASAGVFSGGDVGKIIRSGGGIATVTSFVDASNVRCTITTTITDVIPENAANIPLPQTEGNWSIDPKVSSIGGLWHLEDEDVVVFGDGVKLVAQVVQDGTVAVSTPSSLVLVGKGYTSQITTLPINIKSENVHGKRKRVPAVTIKIENTIYPKMGRSFSDMEAWNLNAINSSVILTNGLYTGEYRRTIGQGWNMNGQVFFEQVEPYPFTLLAVIPEIVVGE